MTPKPLWMVALLAAAAFLFWNLLQCSSEPKGEGVEVDEGWNAQPSVPRLRSEDFRRNLLSQVFEFLIERTTTDLHGEGSFLHIPSGVNRLNV